MSGNYLMHPLEFLINTLFGLYILVVMVRFLLQWVRADFYNPVSQFIVRVTTPALRPLRRVIPGWGGIDFAAVVLMLLLQLLSLTLILLLRGQGVPLLTLLFWSLAELVTLAINIYIGAILIQAIISWINPGTYNPVISLLHALTTPLLRPARRLLPPISGLDLSPLLVLIALQLLKMLAIPPLMMLAGLR
ncbi:MAG: YggT family protein [Gammaproteobacteria bacterium]|nr:YggT family protein [Gammaproteobacteria bacterium]